MENEILDDSIISPETKLVAAEKGKRFANLLIDYIDERKSTLPNDNFFIG